MDEKENMMTVLYIRAGERPVIKKIENSVEKMRSLVGGRIEYFPLGNGIAIICNAEGKMLGLQLNRAIYDDKKDLVEIIAGDFLICSAPPDSESFKSLPKDMIEKYKERFKYPEKFTLTPEGIRVEKDKRVKSRERER